MRVGLDIDDTICKFLLPYIEKFGFPKTDQDITKNVSRILIKDKEFWLNLPILHKPDFIPTLYCTKRVHNKSWTKKFLEINNIPLAPIYQVYSQSSNKANRIKGKIDVFVDDSITNMIQMNLAGVPCLLMNGPHNQSWGPVARIYSLNKEEIIEAYELFMSTFFYNFKQLI